MQVVQVVQPGEPLNMQRIANMQKTAKFVAINDAGCRIGESHPRAVLTDHDVGLVRALLAERDALLAECRAVRMSAFAIQRTLTKQRLSLRLIAEAMEVSKSQIYRISHDLQRAQTPAAWRKVK